MSDTPWHKRYHSDALTGYRGLTLEQRGAYTTILDLLYDSGDASLADAERYMAGQLDVSIRKWRTVRDELISLGKITRLSDGRLTNGRYLREREKAAAISEKRAAAGSKGGAAKPSETGEQMDFNSFSTPENDAKTSRKRAENELKPKELSDPPTPETAENGQSQQANASGLPLYTRADQIPDTRSQIEDTTPAANLESVAAAPEPPAEPTDGIMALAARLSRLGGVSNIRPSAITAGIDTVKKWLADGLDVEADIVPVITRKVVDAPEDGVGGLIYYDRPIRLQKAKGRKPAKKAPPLKPIAATDALDPRVAKFRTELQKRVEPTIWERWLSPERTAMHVNGRGMIITAASAFASNWIEQNLATPLAQSAKATLGNASYVVETLTPNG